MTVELIRVGSPSFDGRVLTKEAAQKMISDFNNDPDSVTCPYGKISSLSLQDDVVVARIVPGTENYSNLSLLRRK